MAKNEMRLVCDLHGFISDADISRHFLTFQKAIKRGIFPGNKFTISEVSQKYVKTARKPPKRDSPL